MQKNNHRSKNEKGSALLLTLGILSLVLIMAMSFSFVARTNRQAAMANADQVKARLLAESGLARIMGGMKFNFSSKLYPAQENAIFNSENNMENNSVPMQHYAFVGDIKSAEAQNSFETLLKAQSTLATQLVDNSDLNLDDGGFMTVKDDQDKIIGRIGILLLEEGGKFDINQLINRRTTADTPPFVKEGEARLNSSIGETFNDNVRQDFYFPICEDYGKTKPTETNTLRLGVLPQEIRVDSKFLDNLPDGYFTSASNMLKTPWFSYEHLINRMDGVSADIGADIFKYTFFSMEEPESFVLEQGGTEYARFDLTGYEGGTDSSASFYDNFVPSSANEACAWNKTDKDAQINDLTADETSWKTFESGEIQTAIPMLSAMKGQCPIINNNTSYEVGKQVAANIIDFCDADNHVTLPSSFDFNASSPAEPAYCGNEKAPGINEIAFTVTPTRISTTNGKSYSYKLSLTPTVELVNIFREKLDIDSAELVVRFIGSINVTCDNKRGHATTPPEHQTKMEAFTEKKFSQNVSIDIDAAETYKSITMSGSDTELLSFTETYSEAKTVESMNGEDKVYTTYYYPPTVTFTLKIEKILAKLSDSSGIVDLAFADNLEDTYEFTRTIQGGETAAGTSDYENHEFHSSLQCLDPMLNHRSADWEWGTKIADATPSKSNTFVENEEIGSGKQDTRTLDDINCHAGLSDFQSLASGYNTDEKIAPSDTSQKYFHAYIKNAPFDSLWELGAIHRGEPFRTINLNKYKEFSPGTDSVTYEEGDAALLDFVKIGPVRYSKGKFNANSRLYSNFAALLTGIELNPSLGTNDSPYDRSKLSYAENAPVSVQNLSDATWPSKPSHSRAALADALSDAATKALGGEDNASDYQTEMLLGRTANLLTTRCDAYTILIVAQSMREFEDQSSIGTHWEVKYFTGTDDAFMEGLLNPTYYDSKYCSILATSVMEVNVVRDAFTNEFKIVRKHTSDQ